MDALNQLTDKLEGIPGYDMAMDWFNEKAEEKYQTKDPYYVEIHGKKKRRKAPDTCTAEEQKAWKKIKKRAWLDDRNFFGCYPVDLGLGLAPIAALIPVIGPLLMFAVHGRLVKIADTELGLPVKLVAKMHANILFDLIISLVPILGSIFAWINACSTRNAALAHTFLVKREMKKERESHQAEIASPPTVQQYQNPTQQPMQQQSAQQKPYQELYTTQTPQGRYSQGQNISPDMHKPQKAYDATQRGRHI